MFAWNMAVCMEQHKDLKREVPYEMKQRKYKLIDLCIRFHIPGDNTSWKTSSAVNANGPPLLFLASQPSSRESVSTSLKSKGSDERQSSNGEHRIVTSQKW
jgi:hypothetical protein